MEKPKPKKQTKSYLDYHECCKFLEQKYGYEERDYGGKYAFHAKIKKILNEKYKDKTWWNIVPANYTKKQREIANEHDELMKMEPEYLDFWHWVVDHHEIHNPCYITFSKEQFNEMTKEPEWIQKIYGYYLKEFANKNGEVEMEVSW